MMLVSVAIRRKTSTPPAPAFRMVRRYGDPLMVAKMGLSTEIIQTSNFQNIVLATVLNGVVSFEAVMQYQLMDQAALDYLRSIQIADAETVQEKLNWLGVSGGDGRPYMTKDGQVAWGTMVWGGTNIQLETDTAGNVKTYTFRGKYKSETVTHDITFVKPVFFRRADMGRPVADLIAECKITKATQAYRPDIWSDKVNGGTIWTPLWSPVDWRVTPGNQVDLYLASDFLENV